MPVVSVIADWYGIKQKGETNMPNISKNQSVQDLLEQIARLEAEKKQLVEQKKAMQEPVYDTPFGIALAMKGRRPITHKRETWLDLFRNIHMVKEYIESTLDINVSEITVHR